MKRLISLILVLALCLGLCACGGSGEPQKPTEPESWDVDTKYVVGTVAEFMVTEDYKKMVADFEIAFHDVTAKIIVREPYVDAAIEYYMADPACHLLILLVRGDFCWDGNYTDVMKLIYDMDTGIFYNSMVGQGAELEARYPGISGTAIESLLFRPDETFTTALGSEPLHTQFEVYHALNSEELATVNQTLGVEAPTGDILYEPLPTEPPTEAPATEPPAEAPSDVPVEAPAEEPEASVDVPAAEAPAIQSGEVTVTEQFLADSVRNFQSSKRYQEIAGDPGSIRITAAFEYALPDFMGHDVHILIVRVDGIDTDMLGFSADTFLVDIRTGNVYHDGSLDLNSWDDFSTVEDAFACIICTTVWENDIIWSEMEIRTELPQSMINAVNSSLS